MKNLFEVYFDCNATTPTHPIAAEAAMSAMQTLYGNPSSSHSSGLLARELLESARSAACEVLKVDRDELTFNSGATEGIQTSVFSAFQALIRGQLGAQGNKALYSAIEHKAVPQALEHWNDCLRAGARIVSLPVSESGLLDLDILRQEIKDAFFLCTMAVNNETGVVQNLQAIERIICEENPKILWLVDCVQALGKIPLNLEKSLCHYAVFSGHKLYAAKGIGLLYAKRSAPFFPLIVGGGQEGSKRSGTENLPGVAAFGAVLRSMKQPKGIFCSHEDLNFFRQLIVQALRDAFPQIIFNTAFDCSVPTTLNFSIPGLTSKDLLDVFDAAGVRISAGSACSAKKAQPSYVLEAMGLPDWRCTSAVRLSFGPATRLEEVQRGCALIRQAGLALQSSCLIPQKNPEVLSTSLKTGMELIQLRAENRNSWLWADHTHGSCCVFFPWSDHLHKILQFIKCQKLTLNFVFVGSNKEGECFEKGENLVQNLGSGVVLTSGGFLENKDRFENWFDWNLFLKNEVLFAQKKETLGPVYGFCQQGIKDGFVFSEVFDQTFICMGMSDEHFAPPLKNLKHESQSGGMSGGFSKSPAVSLGVSEMASWLGQDYLCIDVREKHEFDVSVAWACAGLEKSGVKIPPVNVPLSHLVDFASKNVLHTENRPMLFYCRSGNRSQLAADYLSSLGFSDVSCLKGGVAFFECDEAEGIDFII